MIHYFPRRMSFGGGGGELVARCSVAGCTADSNQRYDKYGGIAEHQKSKLLYCVEHAVEGIRNKTIATWDFKEYGVDEEHPPENYDSLAINPKCVQCEVRLSEDDMGEWLKNPSEPTLCENCLIMVEDEMEHLEAQVEAHIEQGADSRGGRK